MEIVPSTTTKINDVYEFCGNDTTVTRLSIYSISNTLQQKSIVTEFQTLNNVFNGERMRYIDHDGNNTAVILVDKHSLHGKHTTTMVFYFDFDQVLEN